MEQTYEQAAAIRLLSCIPTSFIMYIAALLISRYTSRARAAAPGLPEDAWLRGRITIIVVTVSVSIGYTGVSVALGSIASEIILRVIEEYPLALFSEWLFWALFWGLPVALIVNAVAVQRARPRLYPLMLTYFSAMTAADAIKFGIYLALT